MIYFVIRHKQSKELMPHLRRWGYSHWNPIFPSEKLYAVNLGYPRLFPTLRKAKRAISAWCSMPNKEAGVRKNHNGEYIGDFITADDGRKKEDLEVMKVYIELREIDE